MDPAIDSLATRVEAVRQAASAEELLAATRALALSDHGGRVEESAIACLVEVLGFNNPGAAVAAVEGLIRLGPSAVDPLLSRLDPRNYGARAWAVRALAGIGDVRGLALLEEALGSDVGPSVRRAAAYGLGRLQLEGLPEVERRAVRGRALQSLLAGCRDGEWVVRYAVAVGLELLARSMGPDPEERRQLGESLATLADPGREETPVVQLRARLALERIAEAERPTRVLFVCLGIVIYLWMRFEWKFGVSALIANLHDVVIILGFFAFFQWEFSLTVLAAVLAVLGYSVNESVVVFDRIRENFRKLRGRSVPEIIDNALTRTMSRTIITHGSTQLAVLSMLIFGGEALHGFALALTIGILFGIYSSAFVASALVMWLGVTQADLVKPVKEHVDALP
jgi:hypothetical protein